MKKSFESHGGETGFAGRAITGAVGFGLLVASMFSIPGSHAAGAELPMFTGFEFDTLGEIPETSELLPYRPTGHFFDPATGSMSVSEDSNGLPSQYVRLHDPTGQLACVHWSIPDAESHVHLRLEATIVIEESSNVSFIEVYTTTDLLAIRIDANDDGTITSALGNASPIGTYVPGVPFRVRIDIDRDIYVYYVSIDSGAEDLSDDELSPLLLFTTFGISRFQVGSRSSLGPTSDLSAVGIDDVAILPLPFSETSFDPFQRGDVTENGVVNIHDVLRMLDYIAEYDPDPRCEDARDVNDDGRFSLSDPIYLLRHLFIAEHPMASPSGSCGFDQTLDGLRCDNYMCP